MASDRGASIEPSYGSLGQLEGESGLPDSKEDEEQEEHDKKNSSNVKGLQFRGRGEKQDNTGGGGGIDEVPKVMEEVQAQCQLAWPLIVSSLSTFSFVLVSVMFVGHLGELELSSASIANSFTSVTGFSVMMGLSSALETLSGQAVGAKTYRLVGVYFQSALIVNYSFCVPIGILWWNLERVLLAVGEDPQISRLAGSYIRYIIPGLLSSPLSQPLLRVLQTNRLVLPVMIISLLVACLHPLVCYLAIYTFGFGYYGGAIATTGSFWFLSFLLSMYAIFSGKCDHCWPGVVIREALASVGMYLKLALASMMMLCLEYWSFQILVLLSGLLPNPSLELSLLSISVNTSYFVYMIPYGFSMAASIRVSNELGANRPEVAKLAMKVVLGLAALEACTLSLAMFLARHVWGLAFSHVKEVLYYVTQVIPLLAISTFLDAIQGVLSGVIRGSGRQTLGASINLGAFYCIAIPVALFMGFKLHYNAKGLLIGLISGVFMRTAFLLFFVLRTDWTRMAAEAQERVRRKALEQEPLLPSNVKNLQG